MAVMTKDQAYIALHRDFEKALTERRELIEALRNVLRNDKFKAIAETKAYTLLRNLGELK